MFFALQAFVKCAESLGFFVYFRKGAESLGFSRRPLQVPGITGGSMCKSAGVVRTGHETARGTHPRAVLGWAHGKQELEEAACARHVTGDPDNSWDRVRVASERRGSRGRGGRVRRLVERRRTPFVEHAARRGPRKPAQAQAPPTGRGVRPRDRARNGPRHPPRAALESIRRRGYPPVHRGAHHA